MRYLSPYIPPRRAKRPGLLGIGFLRLIGITLLAILISSFYIYQRVWVRTMVAYNEKLEKRNDVTRQRLAQLEAAWMTASSLGSIETAILDGGLGLEPTKPSQNFVVQAVLPVVPSPEKPDGPYTGLATALGKLKQNMPIVESAEAEAEPLFKTK
ncbi:MAG: hypothetical protein GYA46_11315 [candidate division Zixibacteria bacterium]|nr:hypothetical protein [candidate division Zixibacteria bacterium]